MVLFLFLPIVGQKKGRFIVPGMTIPKGFVKAETKSNFSNISQKNKRKKKKTGPKIYVGWR